jgi:hypothetical protein
MTRPQRALPTITDPNEVVIEFLDDAADDFRRRRFLAYWLADNVGPARNERGTRGQIFVTYPDQFIKGHQARGHTVRYWTADE